MSPWLSTYYIAKENIVHVDSIIPTTDDSLKSGNNLWKYKARAIKAVIILKEGLYKNCH